MDDVTTLSLQGEFLREHNRYDESIAAFKQALAQEPNNAALHSELALTYLDHPEDKYKRNALDSIKNAIGLSPENEVQHAIKGLIYIHLDKPQDARKAAEAAIEINPELALAWTVKAQSYFPNSRWDQAEENLRMALRLDPDYDRAKNLLSIVLRAQGKIEASQAETKGVLSRNAEDPIAHANVGWTTLQQGDYKQAESHFKTALQLDPQNEYARDGLREAYKARSWFFRLYLKYTFFMQKFSQGTQIAIFVGLYFAFKFGRAFLEAINPLLAGLLLAAYLAFAFWTLLANGIGHFILLKDPLARLTLNKREKLDGIFVGGGFLVGVLIGVGGHVCGLPALTLAGGALALASIPWGRVFMNDSKVGQKVFGALACITYLIGFSAAISILVLGGQHEISTGLTASAIPIGVLACFGSTWLGLIPGLSK